MPTIKVTYYKLDEKFKSLTDNEKSVETVNNAHSKHLGLPSKDFFFFLPIVYGLILV